MNCKGANEAKAKIKELETQIKRLESAKTGDTKYEDKTVKEHLELRLKETLEEAKRHYSSYIKIRDEYNSFLESRINTVVEACTKLKPNDPTNSVKASKAKADLIQMMRANLEAQQQQLEQEIQEVRQTEKRVSQGVKLTIQCRFSDSWLRRMP